jgi:hypothetical protein
MENSMLTIDNPYYDQIILLSGILIRHLIPIWGFTLFSWIARDMKLLRGIAFGDEK